MQLNKLLEKKPRSNAAAITAQLLKKLKVPVTAVTLENALELHPDFPSLYSISDNLSKWEVETMALKVESEKLEEIPTPFIARSRVGGGNFVLVNRVDGVVDLIDEKGKQQQKSREAFIKEWDNVVLLAERNEHSGEKNYRTNRRKERIDAMRNPSVAVACLLLIVLQAVFIGNEWVSLILLLKFSGSFICGLLLR